MVMTQNDKEREAAWLNAAMAARGWENRDVARETGLDPNWISQWKIANRPIPDLALFKLAKALGHSAFEVRPALREYSQFFLESSPLDELSPEDQKLALKMIEGLLAVSGGISAVSKAQPRKLAAIDKERK